MTLGPKRLEAAAREYCVQLEIDPFGSAGHGVSNKQWAIGEITPVLTAYLEAGDDWQPIETAPKDGTFVLICVSHETRDPVIGEARFLPATRFFEAEWWWQGCAPEQYINCEPISQTNFGKPTHWQPLPQPPKKGDVS